MWDLAIALFFALGPAPHRIVVSRYADTPKDEGGTPACWRRIPDAEFDAKYARRCASRTLPCGTPVALVGYGRASLCYVLDRGPYGRRDDGSFRGQLDLSPLPASEIGIWSAASSSDSPGRLPVAAWPLRR